MDATHSSPQVNSSAAAALPDETTLPDDPTLLKRMILELLATLQSERQQREQVTQRLDQLLRRLYGPKSEKLDPGQLLLFALAEQAESAAAANDSPAAAPAAPPPATTQQPRRRGHGRKQLPKHLRREQRLHDVPEAEKLCSCCGQHCQEGVSIAPLPPQPIDKGLAGPGLVAHIAVNKYADHLPLYRQEAILARQGVDLSRQTLCGWLAAAASLLSPLWQRMARVVLQSRVIHTDDTPLKVQDPQTGAMSIGRLWTYLGDATHPYTIYDFTMTRKRDGPAQFLKGFAGYLQADAFSGYDGIYVDSQGAIHEVACWAHARRKFYEARSSAPTEAHAALAQISQLYQIERDAAERKLDDEQRRLLRHKQARPVLDSLGAWLHQQAASALPKSPIGQAIAYARSNWAALCRYPEQGYLAIDNNVAERAMKAVVIGRKNWLFAGSEGGGRTAAIMFTLTMTCKRLAIDPWVYLRDVLERISTHPAARIDELLPDHWQALRVAATPAVTPSESQS